MSLRVAIVLVATGPYRRFLPESLASLRRRLFVGHERRFHVFTDEADLDLPDGVAFHVPHLAWPHNTLFRYHYMRHARGHLADADAVAYIDVDMVVETDVKLDEVVAAQTAYFGVQHPWHRRGKGPFETNPASTAWVDRSAVDTKIYWQACFWGGWARPFVDMVEVLADRVDTDLRNGVVAIWHDESHLNRFFVEHEPQVRTLRPGFAFPDGMAFGYLRYRRRIRHLAKPRDQFPCHAGPPAALIRTPPIPQPWPRLPR